MANGRKTAAKIDLNHLHLHVRNMNRARRFYESYFGFREHMRVGDILFLRNADGFDLTLRPDRAPGFVSGMVSLRISAGQRERGAETTWPHDRWRSRG